MKEIDWEGLALVYLTQDKDKWQAVVKTVINLPVLQNLWICSIELSYMEIG